MQERDKIRKKAERGDLVQLEEIPTLMYTLSPQGHRIREQLLLPKSPDTSNPYDLDNNLQN